MKLYPLLQQKNFTLVAHLAILQKCNKTSLQAVESTLEMMCESADVFFLVSKETEKNRCNCRIFFEGPLEILLTVKMFMRKCFCVHIMIGRKIEVAEEYKTDPHRCVLIQESGKFC